MRVGVELEGFVFSNWWFKDGGPVNVYHWILSEYGREEWQTPEGVVVKTSAGWHMIELALPPVDLGEISLIPEMIHNVLKRFPPDWKFYWEGVDPCWIPSDQLWTPKKRYLVLKRALMIECPQRWWGIEAMAKVAALHVHLDVDYSDKKEVIRLLNIFNNVNNGLQKNYASRERIKKWWFGWANPCRLPSKKSRIFSSYEQLEEFIGRIPRLLKKDENTGEFQVDLKNPSQLGDSLAEETIWWWCRPRKSLGTIEVRIADSMEPKRIPGYIGKILSLI